MSEETSRPAGASSVSARALEPDSVSKSQQGKSSTRKPQRQKKAKTSAAPQSSDAVDEGGHGGRESAPASKSDGQPNQRRGNASKSELASSSNLVTTQQRQSQPEKGKSEKRKKKGKGKASKQSGKDGEGSSRPKRKVIIRRLPPNLPENIFWNAVAPWVRRPRASKIVEAKSQAQEKEPSAEPMELDEPSAPQQPNVDACYYVAGKLKDRSRRGVVEHNSAFQHTFSRAYVRFTDTSHLLKFHQGFDGHVFRDAKGNEYRAVVEFAPFDHMPGDAVRRRKADPLAGTIDSDAHYKAFLTSLEAKSAGQGNGESQNERTEAQLLAHLGGATAETTQAEQAKHTPLLEHLRAQRAAKQGASSKSRGKKSGDARTTAKKAGAGAEQAKTGKTMSQKEKKKQKIAAGEKVDVDRTGSEKKGRGKKTEKGVAKAPTDGPVMLLKRDGQSEVPKSRSKVDSVSKSQTATSLPKDTGKVVEASTQQQKSSKKRRPGPAKSQSAAGDESAKANTARSSGAASHSKARPKPSQGAN